MTRSTSSRDYDSFRLMLIEARKSAGLTQAVLAVRLARPQSYVSKYERGKRRLDVIEFLDIANAIDIKLTDFIDKLKNKLNSK